MKIHGVCILKDEIDIIEETLSAAQTWCDHIYIYDNGSTDGTWEKVQVLSRDSNGQIELFKRSDTPYHERMVGEVYERYHKSSTVGDWWNRLDADEFYIDDPKEFLASVPHGYDCVFSSSYQYYFTDKDYERYRHNPTAYADGIPVREKCKYYLNNWSELRFIRQTRSTVWDRHVAWPYKRGRTYPRRIRLKHYQYRSPDQIQRRLDVRFKNGGTHFPHETLSTWKDIIPGMVKASNGSEPSQNGERVDWRSRLVDASLLDYDGDAGPVSRDNLLPSLPLEYSLRRQMTPAYFLKLKHQYRRLKRQYRHA